jgi:hypothetical protein
VDKARKGKSIKNAERTGENNGKHCDAFILGPIFGSSHSDSLRP